MRDPHDIHTIEKALQGLMPPALSVAAQTAIEADLDSLAAQLERPAGKVIPTHVKAALGMAAALALGGFVFFRSAPSPLTAEPPPMEVEILAESDRVEAVRDIGLFVDPGGSAVRKLRVRVVEESRMRDPETGIELTLSEPRQETYLLPVSTF